MTCFLVDCSTGQIRTLDARGFVTLFPHSLMAGYFVAWSESAARYQQRAIFREVAKESACACPEDVRMMQP